MKIKALEKALRKAWSEESCYPPLRDKRGYTILQALSSLLELTMKKIIFLTFFVVLRVFAQLPSAKDSSIRIYEPPSVAKVPDTLEKKWRMGPKLFLSFKSSGFGLFYMRRFDKTNYLLADFTFFEDKEENEESRRVMDYITGITYTWGKLNTIIDFSFNLYYARRLFYNEIADNFKLFAFGGAGAVLVTMFPYLKPVGESIKLAKSKWTAGASAGILVITPLDAKSIIGIGIKYAYIPYPNGVISLEGNWLKKFSSIVLFLVGGS